MKLLLAHDALPDIHDDSAFTALHYAADMGYSDIVTVLLEAGADCNFALLPDRWTALHCKFTDMCVRARVYLSLCVCARARVCVCVCGVYMCVMDSAAL